MENVLLSPPVVLAVFVALAYGLHQLGGAIAAQGEPTPDKHRPYTGGEISLPPARRMRYHAFFRLALIFAVLHLAVLVLSLLPPIAEARRLGLVYLLGVGISVLILIEDEL